MWWGNVLGLLFLGSLMGVGTTLLMQALGELFQDWYYERNRKMGPEEIRQMIVKDLDDALSSFWVNRVASRETIRLMKAQREYWQAVDATELSALLNLYNKEPQ